MPVSPHQPIELVFLGSGNAFARDRYWSSFLLNGRYLFDAPPIILPHLKKLRLPLAEIEAVFVSHFHGDHILGLPFLLLEYAEVTTRSKDLAILGPPGVRQVVESITEAVYPGVVNRDAGYSLRYVEFQDAQEMRLPLSDGELIFKALRVEHTPKLDCYGLRVETDGRVVAYSGDAARCDALLELAEGADVFVLDCSCWEDDCGPHLSPRDIAELREEISPSTTFILTHLDAGRIDLGLEGVLLAEDFATFRL